ncbi:hypothetical protein PV328_007644 [Microctonus aethiopoides]|uniref:Uncharacterized protein n=1 Tax=Microctonus aethiopoides TaxID=144406 RepID=A0AA39F0S0_9HYME|nr:hypothetical protein PV328_007644 [Microctonus aethiopoides]
MTGSTVTPRSDSTLSTLTDNTVAPRPGNTVTPRSGNTLAPPDHRTPEASHNSANQTRRLRSDSPAELSTELTLKVKTQIARFQLLREMCTDVHSTDTLLPEEVVTEHLNYADSVHKAFLKEHSYFEVTWPKAFTHHEYFAENVFMSESYVYARIKTKLIARKEKPVAPPQSTPATTSSTHLQTSKLPDLALPDFSGDMKEWSSFKEMSCSNIDKFTGYETRITEVVIRPTGCTLRKSPRPDPVSS